MQKRLKQAIFAGTQPAAEPETPLTPIEKLQALQKQMPQAGYIRQAGLLEVLPISPATLWRWAPMATPNCSTYGRSNCSRQDGRIMTMRV